MKEPEFDIEEVFYRVNEMFKDPDKTTAEYINRVTGKLHLPELTFKLLPKNDGWYEIYPHPANPTIGYGLDEKAIVSVSFRGLFIGIGYELSGWMVTEIDFKEDIIYLKLQKDGEEG